MLCPYCSDEESRVVDKRDIGGFTRRRRECLRCKKRFNTLEKVESAGLRVIKKDGRREGFDKEKMKKGIIKACEKRPISSEQIDKMAMIIEEKLRKMGRDIKSISIGELVSRELKKIDKVAYIRFASVYKDFSEIEDFKKEIKELIKI